MLAYSASRLDTFIASSFFISSRGALSVSFASTSAVLRRRLAALATRAWSSNGKFLRTRSAAANAAASAATPHAVCVVAVDPALALAPRLVDAPESAATAAAARVPASSAAARATDAMTSLVADMAERSTARSNSGVHASSITVPECGTKLAPFAVAVSAYFIAACLAAIVTAGLSLIHI